MDYANTGGLDMASTRSLDPLDPARKYGSVDPNNKNNFSCNFCGKVTKGGAFRLKQHLVGGFRNVTKCVNCPEHVREEVKFFMIKKKQAKVDSQMLSTAPQYDIDVSVDEEEEEFEILYSRGSSTGQKSSKFLPKKPRKKSPLDMYFTPNPEGAIKDRRDGKGNFGACNNEELRDNVCRDIARWFYDVGISFNAANYESFRLMIEAIGQYGPGMKPPSMHELKVPLLKKEVDETHMQMEDHMKEWAHNGCSILFDVWCDSVAQKDIVNVFVNSSKGSMFIKSIDVSKILKDVNLLFQVLDDMVEEVGEQNVVQVVTNSASNYVKAGRLLEAKRPTLYWTPCATHCIDLMLEDIGKIPKVKNALRKCMFINGYIYSHVSLVNMMRRFTKQRNLYRPAVTRFATSFITLAQFHKHKNNLRNMVTSQVWNSSKWPKKSGGKKVASFLLQDLFWKHVVYALKLTRPLIKVLQMIVEEKKPPMGYIFEVVNRAKETIAKSFSMKEELYKKAFEHIDARWDCQLDRPLRAAGYFLNPEILYDNPNLLSCEEVMKGLYECIERLNPDLEIQDKILLELDVYRNASGLFGLPIAVRQRKTIAPEHWWSSFGASTPNLQKFAVRVVSLTCSATGCERNWGVFELIHTTKRNRVAQGRLNELVYVKSNRALKRRKETTNSIFLEEIDESNEWLLGRMDEDSSNDEADFVFDDDDLTRGASDRAAGAYDLRCVSRMSRTVRDCSLSSSKAHKGKGPSSGSAPKASRRVLVDDGDDDDDDEMEEDIGEDEDYEGDDADME